jgi:acyl-CoA synthetase (AMP-forming)/AMP-acid ligase II
MFTPSSAQPALNNVCEILDRDESDYPSPLITIVDNQGQLSEHSLSDYRKGAYRWAATIAPLIGDGGRVVLTMPTTEHFLHAYFGTLLAGGVAVPMPYAFHRQAEYLDEYLKTRASVIDDCGAELIATLPGHQDVAEQLVGRCDTLRKVLTADLLVESGDDFERVDIQPDRLAMLQYTSGSTGTPKGVSLTHACLCWNLRGIGERLEAVPDDVVVSWLPLYHDMGLIGGCLWPLSAGLKHSLMATEVFLSNPTFWLQAMTQLKASITVAPNFGYALAVKRVKDDLLPFMDLSRMRIALTGAEPIDASVIAAFHDKFAAAKLRPNTVLPCYGLAEATLAVTFRGVGEPIETKTLDRRLLENDGRAVQVPHGTPGAIEVVNVGRPLRDGKVKIIDTDGNELPDGQQGEILAMLGSLMTGYHRNPEASAETLRGGWLHTGDLGFVDSGELYVTGRIKDLIITYGRNFYPHDIEWLAAEVDGVRQGCVAAFGVTNKEASTEEIVVVAETRKTERAALITIRRSIRKLLISTIECNPKHIVLVPPRCVPKTTSGKIRRLEARRLFLKEQLERLL